MATITLYRANLKTGGKSPEQIIESFRDFKPSDEEIKNWIAAYDLLDGIEVVVMKSFDGKDYCLVAWQDDDAEKIRDYIYQAEQDPMFGTYVDEREEFLNDWDSDEYEPSGSLVFSSDDVEIIEELKK